MSIEQNEVPVSTLPVGTRFGMYLSTTGRTMYGTLLYVSSGSALVEWESTPRTVTVHDSDGNESTFQATVRKREHVSLQTPVIREET
jgi:hypothetical protein